MKKSINFPILAHIRLQKLLQFALQWSSMSSAIWPYFKLSVILYFLHDLSLSQFDNIFILGSLVCALVGLLRCRTTRRGALVPSRKCI